MSDFTTAARPYARAVFDTATAHAEQKKWTEALSLMAAVVRDPITRALLDSPRLPQQQIADVLISVCDKQLTERGKNFIRLLAENDRIKLLPEIAVLYEDYRADAEGTVDAEAVFAIKANESQLAKIAASLKKRLGKEIRLTSRVDRSLIGGAIVYVGDLVIDGSIRGRLNKLSTALKY
jgi:F-type H+-transporting ATPase subunit delta